MIVETNISLASRVLKLRVLVGAVLVSFAFVSTSAADTYIANLDAFQVAGSSSEPGTAVATFVLDDAQENLSYSIQVFGMDLKPVAADRTGFSDIDKIHLHNGFAGNSGPHVLNIFGLPSEDDAEMVVDFDTETIDGVFNNADAIDPNTGEPFDQNSPTTTKLLSNFVDDLLAGQLYLAIHTAGQNGNIAVRGQLVAVPEPSSVVVLAMLAASLLTRRPRRNQ